MGDLLEYFEAQSRNLDEMSASLISPLPSNFTSVIRFNGIPILPPVMTQKRKEEMLTYRRQAMRLENRRKSKQREKLVARVQSIVAEVEEKQNSRLSDSIDSSPVSSGTDVSSKWSPESASSSKSAVGDPKKFDSSSSKNKNISQPSGNKTMATEKGKRASTIGDTAQQEKINKTEKVFKEQRTKIPAPVQSTSKHPEKGKGKPSSKSQGKALTNLRKSSSMSSLPNPAKIPGTPSFPLPKPPTTKMTELQARRSNLLLAGRLSFSNPDLRDFDDDNSLSCKSESGISRKSGKRKNQSALQLSNQHSASDPDISRNVGESQGFVLSPEDPVLTSPKIHRLKKQPRSTGSNPELSSVQYFPEIDAENFREEVTDVKRTEQKSETKSTKDIKKKSPSPARKNIISKDTAKSQSAAQEQKYEEPQSLNDLPSLDDCNSLPHEFNGIPLTSVKQQQIGQVLAKLSKCLNLQDTGGTLNSTSSSSSTENNAKQSIDSKVPNKKTDEDDRKSKFFPSPTLHDNSGNSGKEGSEVNLSGLNQSAVNSSVVSSVGSVGTNQSKRMSPKGLKNTVHFSSFITEISTSASQSVEDKISVRKMDITPTNSVDLAGSTGLSYSSEVKGQGQYGKSVPKNVKDLGSSIVPQVTIAHSSNSLLPGQPGSMLSKVALSPDESPGGMPKTFFKDQEVPFHVYTAEIEHNTSDKENESIHLNKFPLEIEDKMKSLEKELNKNCEQTYGNIFMLTGKRSVDSDEKSQGSTLKESQENIQAQKQFCRSDIYSDSNKTDLEKVLKVSTAVAGSSGHLTGEVNQSNRLSQGTSATVDKPKLGSDNLPKTVPKTSSHVRRGSYTVEQPSETLINTVSYQRNTQNPNNYTNMNIGPGNQEPVSVSENNTSIVSSQSAEQNAKAEHIQRYLSQVQKHSVDNDLDNSPHHVHNSHNGSIGQYEIGEAVRSFTETLQSMESLTEEEMLKIQSDHFNKIRQHLIEQQKQQLEELFVQQRREQMKLQQEIETHHNQLRQQQEFLSSFSDPVNLSQYSVDDVQNTSINSYSDPMQRFVQHSANSNVRSDNRVQMNASNSYVSVSSQHPYIPTYSKQNYPSNVCMPTNNLNSFIQTTLGNGYVPTAPGNGYNPTMSGNSLGNGYIPTASGNGYNPTTSGNSCVPTTSGNGYYPTTQGNSYTNSGNGYFPNGSMISNIPGNYNQPIYSQHMPANYPTQQKQFSYISSPSLYFNPKDRDNESDISTFSKVTPKQSLKFNQSTPSPKNYKPVVHSPVKDVQPAWTSSTTVAFPEAAFDPRLQPCFDKLSACVKGYLTRRLLVTEKVQEMVKTISDTKCFARSFQQETPIKKGQVNHQDRDLLDRIIAQLQAALLDIHEIFFDIPMWERMQIIAHDRQVRDERRLRESGATTRSSVSTSQPRISSATLKAIERKRKAQEAEAAVFGDIRPRTAPPVSQRCQRESMDMSGPLRRHFQFLISRALQPVHASHSHNTTQSGNTTARIKTRPKTAASQPVQHQQPIQPTTNPTIQQTTVPKQKKTTGTAKPSSSTSTVPTKKKKTGKAWR